jgi:pimeloyl-ACP methyl ester carboxylesterase
MLFRLILFVLALAIVVAVVGPLLIDPTPAPGQTQAEAVAPEQSRFVSIPFAGTDGLKLHYIEAEASASSGARPGASSGDLAPTFVLLHGFTFNAFTWNRSLDLFTPLGCVVAYDQIPYGLSAKPLPGTWSGPNPYAKSAAVEQLFAFMDALGIGPAILVGNSSGGTLALEAALADPERIQALILLGPWVHAKRPIFPRWFASLPQIERLSLLLARYLGGTGPLLDYSYADPARIDDQRRALTGIHRQMANWDLAWAALLDHSLTDPVEVSAHLDAITQPVLVITGAEDRVVPVQDSRATAEELPNASFVVVPDCGHLPQEECPELVGQAVTEWLATQMETQTRIGTRIETGD